MSDIDYNDLDPGIREVVWWLRSHGFHTTDSGDGVSKWANPPEWMAPEDEQCGVLRVPHVFMVERSGRAGITAGNHLARLLRARGIDLSPIQADGSGVCIQVTYDVGNPELTTIALFGVTSEMVG